jgi:negative regulator of sigma E activity
LNRALPANFTCNFVWLVVFNQERTMNDEPRQNPLRELVWRRKLTRAELNAQPGVQADLEIESRLSEALADLPDAPMPSNFTALVLQAIEREGVRPHATGWNWYWTWRVLVPRAAVAAVVIFFAGLGIHHHELNAHRAALAKKVVLMAAAQPMPSVDALKNFNAIQRMSQPHADDELLALLR